METMSKYFSKEDLQRKKSEDWAREKAKEWADSNSVLTFAEWCYQQGKAEAREKMIDEIHTRLVSAFNEKYSFNDSHLLEFEVLDIIADTIKQLKEQK